MHELRKALVGGMVATAVASALASAARRLGIFDLSFPKLLGTAVTDRGQAGVIGVTLHVVNGVGAAAAYLIPLRRLPPELRMLGGAGLGTVHSLVAIAALAVLPRVHPRPRLAGLRPAGSLDYGTLTIPILVAGHALYGALIGYSLREPEE